MIGRLRRYVVLAYRPTIQVPVMACWAVGLTAFFAGADPRVVHWRIGSGLAVTALTLIVDMLLLRALDDIRDRDYDSRHNPGRPLADGTTEVRDLVALIGFGAVLLTALNAYRGWAAIVLIVHLGYAIAVIGVDQILGWPPGDRLFLHLGVNLPILPLLSCYVYAAFLHDEGLAPSRAVLLPLAAATLAGLCLEFGRKARRGPAIGERSYSTVLGAVGTTMVALLCAVAAAVVAVVALRETRAPALLATVPVLLPMWSAWRFQSARRAWPVMTTIAYLPATYLSFLLACCLSKGVNWS